MSNGGVCVLDIIEMLSDVAVDCEYLSKEENNALRSLPAQFRNSAFGATMRNSATVLGSVANGVRTLMEDLQSIIE